MGRLTLVVIFCLLLLSCAPVPLQTQNPRNPELILPERAMIEGIKIKKGQGFTDCVEVSLEAIFDFYGANINRKEISDQIQNFSGTTRPDMIAFVIERGFNIFCFLDEEQDKKWIKYFLSRNMPVMVPGGFLRYGHMVVLVGYDDNKKIFFVADPGWRSIQKCPYQEFNEWHYKVHGGNEAFLVYPEFKQIEALSGGKTPTELKKYSSIQGFASLKKRQYERAISDFSKALEIEPKSPDVYNNRGIAYGSKGQYEEAISDFDKAIEIDPGLSKAWFNRGLAYYSKKEYDKCWEDVHRAQALGYEIPPRFLDDLRKASGREK